MTKKELIDRITTVNRRATREFLAEFSERELTDYVRQLHILDADGGASRAVASQEQPAETLQA